MGDSARKKRREQLKRWAGSSTDRTPAAARRRWRLQAENGPGEEEAEPGSARRDPPVSEGREETGPLLKRRLEPPCYRALTSLGATNNQLVKVNVDCSVYCSTTFRPRVPKPETANVVLSRQRSHFRVLLDQKGQSRENRGDPT